MPYQVYTELEVGGLEVDVGLGCVNKEAAPPTTGDTVPSTDEIAFALANSTLVSWCKRRVEVPCLSAEWRCSLGL